MITVAWSREYKPRRDCYSGSCSLIALLLQQTSLHSLSGWHYIKRPSCVRDTDFSCTFRMIHAFLRLTCCFLTLNLQNLYNNEDIADIHCLYQTKWKTLHQIHNDLMQIIVSGLSHGHNNDTNTLNISLQPQTVPNFLDLLLKTGPVQQLVHIVRSIWMLNLL